MKSVLETGRLTLVPFAKDLALLHDTFTNPFVREYLWDDETISPEQTSDILDTNLQAFDNESWGLWKILLKKDRAYVGFAGLWIFFEETQPQLLYGLLPESTGRGYATEAAAAVVDYAFDQLGFSYLTASFDTPHIASRRVCQNLDMEEMNTTRINGKLTTFYRIEKKVVRQ